MSTLASLDQVTLEWLKVQVSSAVSAEFAESMRPEVYRDEVLGHLVYQLRCHVLADRLPPESVTTTDRLMVQVPASPWQQFKSTHAAKWWLRALVRRRPVRMVEHAFTAELTVELSRFWTYPEAKELPERFGRPYKAMTMAQSVTWDET